MPEQSALPWHMTGPKTLMGGLVAVTAWAGLAIQLWLSLRIASVNGKSFGSGLISYLGYFTILTNLFVALATTLPLAASVSGLGKWSARGAVYGCAVTAITGVGISYHILLRNIWNPQGWQWVADMTLHYAVPLLALALWIVFSSKGTGILEMAAAVVRVSRSLFRVRACPGRAHPFLPVLFHRRAGPGIQPGVHPCRRPVRGLCNDRGHRHRDRRNARSEERMNHLGSGSNTTRKPRSGRRSERLSVHSRESAPCDGLR